MDRDEQGHLSASRGTFTVKQSWWVDDCSLFHCAGTPSTADITNSLKPWLNKLRLQFDHGGYGRVMALDDHGSASTYRNHGCRCELCKKAWAAFIAARRAIRFAAPLPVGRRHGEYTTYTNYGCRCALCRKAMVAVSRRRRGKKDAARSTDQL